MRKIRQIGKIGKITSVGGSSVNYGMEFLQANTDKVDMPIPYINGNDFYIKTRVKATGLGQDYYAMGDNVSPKFWFGVNQANNKMEAGLFTQFVTPSLPIFALDEWYEIEVGYRDGAGEIYIIIDGVERDTTAATSIASQDIDFILGKIGVVPFNSGDWIIDWIDADGEMFKLNKIVGGKIVGSLGTQHTITTDRGDVNDMLVAI